MLLPSFSPVSSVLFAVTPYTGNGSTQSIVTGQNLSGGGLVWGKETGATGNHELGDSIRGANKQLYPNLTNAENSLASITAYNSNGFSVGTGDGLNANGDSIVAFSWLEQAGYMDVVTYTGNGSGAGQSVAHNLTVTPSFIILKNRTNAQEWPVYHSSLGAGNKIVLNTTAAASASAFFGTQTSSNLVLGSGSGEINAAANNYVAYLFAEKAGKSKFGAQSGTTTINTGLPSIKAVLKKRTDSTGDWYLFYNDGGTWYHVKTNTTDARATGLITVSGGDITFSGAASTGTGIYAAWG